MGKEIYTKFRIIKRKGEGYEHLKRDEIQKIVYNLEGYQKPYKDYTENYFEVDGKKYSFVTYENGEIEFKKKMEKGSNYPEFLDEDIAWFLEEIKKASKEVREERKEKGYDDYNSYGEPEFIGIYPIGERFV